MQQMWSPWRSQYINSFKNASEDSACFLCKAEQSAGHERELLLLWRHEYCFVIMNRFPYNSGHLMVAPRRHIGEFTSLNAAELGEIMRIMQDCAAVLGAVLAPHGMNIGANLGRAAGAGLPDHIHFHLVPRWNGDTNFMPALADIKVVSEAMEESYDKLYKEFARYYEQHNNSAS